MSAAREVPGASRERFFRGGCVAARKTEHPVVATTARYRAQTA
jgi:hypothetical protein